MDNSKEFEQEVALDETTSTEEVNKTPSTEEATEAVAESNNYKEQLNKEKAKEGYQNRKKNKLPDFEEKLAEMREQLSAEMRAEMRAEQERNLIKSMASNADEAELIGYILDNKLKRTDDMVEDIRAAKLLANKSKYETLEKETGAMQRSTMSGARIASAGNIDAQPESKFTPEEEALISKFGLDPKTGKPLS